MQENISIKWLQDFIKEKDYNLKIKHGYFLKLIEEVGELSEAIRKGHRQKNNGEIKGTIEEELYDALYYIIALANVYDIDLEESCRQKEAINEKKYRELIKLEWNKLFESYGQDRPVIDDWLDKFAHLLEHSRETPVIDLGCGFGNDTLYLYEHGLKVISCDYSEGSLKRLGHFIRKPDTRLFDMQDGLPFADNSARVIIADLSLHYFSSTVTCKIIDDISRVLVDGGFLIGRVNSSNDTEYGAGQGVKIEDNYYCIKGRYKRFFDRKHLEDFFSDWRMEYVNECTMDRYPKPKLVWEFSVKNLKP